MLSLDEKRLFSVLGNNIKALRQNAGLSQDDLAAKIGLIRTSVANIESGRQKPPLATVYRICLAFRVNLTDVLPPVEDCMQASLFEYFDQDSLPELASDVLKKYKE